MVAHDFSIPPRPEALARSLFTKIDNILNEIDYLPYMETVEGEWCILDEDTLYYTDTSCKDVYGGEIREGIHQQDDCFIINTDNGCGETITMVCKSENQITYDNFLDKYEEYM